MPSNQQNVSDLVIAGGGLAGILAAWRCLGTGNADTVTILDAGDNIAGDHTWSFHQSDLSPEGLQWIRPAVAHEWPSYDVHFPAFSRQLPHPYLSMNSASLRAAVAPLITQGRLHVVTGRKVKGMRPTSILLDGGEAVEGKTVLNAMGFKPSANRVLGYQKFVGQVVRTAAPHGLSAPIIMDATVEQNDGYRFVYCLPFSEQEVLIEDTYYEDGPALDKADVIQRIAAYAVGKGWQVAEITRTESGILPITLASDLDRQMKTENPGVSRIGLAGGLYHAVTGYSLPDAVRTAERIGSLKTLTPDSVYTAVLDYRKEHWEREKFFRLLNRMLFKAGTPQERYKVLQRFYRLDEELVAGFYRGDITFRQKARILSGKPPVPIGAAIHNLSERKFLKRMRSEH